MIRALSRTVTRKSSTSSVALRRCVPSERMRKTPTTGAMSTLLSVSSLRYFLLDGAASLALASVPPLRLLSSPKRRQPYVCSPYPPASGAFRLSPAWAGPLQPQPPLPYRHHQPHRFYSRARTANQSDSGGSSSNASNKEASEAEMARLSAAREYSRRAQYKASVSALRREYAEAVARQRASDRAEREALERELTRRRLERQRLKNVRSAQGAIRQERQREARAEAFREHLDAMQRQRDAKEQLYVAARQIAIDELEKEAPMWLTTPEEVEAAFTPESEQMLWARPGGTVGAPNPSLDSRYWQLETHTWHMDRTYMSQRDVLLERLEEMAYEEANVDRSVWTDERVQERRQLEDKARLREMVQWAGRIELLRRQRQMLWEGSSSESGSGGTEDDGGIPQPAPVPSLRVLQNRTALEREGSRLLMEDPTKFFVFDGASTRSSSQVSSLAETDDSTELLRPGAESSSFSSSEKYSGPSLGSPIALRDPLRDGSHQDSAFPNVIGRIPRPDTRTEREKKQQEREERMWAAARAEKQNAAASSEDREIELAAQQQTLDDLEPDLNYDDHEWDWQDEEWKKGTDPVEDTSVLNTPREERYTEDDIDWVSSQLESRVKHLEQQLRYDLENLKHGVGASHARAGSRSGPDAAQGADTSLEAALLSLPEPALLELSDLDERYSEGTLTQEELSAAAASIKGLSEDQVMRLLRRDRT